MSIYSYIKGEFNLSILQRLIQQAKNPRGTIGSSMLCIMNTAHTRLTNWGLQKIHIKTDAVILDIGCGGGKTIHTLSKRTPLGKIYGIDYSDQAVKNSIQTNIKEVFRVLQPNGSFLLVAETFKIQYHMEKCKTNEELINLFYKTGFTNVKCYEERGCLCVIGVK